MKSLFLFSHPSARLAVHGWDAIYRKIIYRSDPRTLFKAPKWPFRINKFGDGGGRPKDVATGVGEIQYKTKHGAEGVAGDVSGSVALDREAPSTLSVYQEVMKNAAEKFCTSQISSCIGDGGRVFFSARILGSSLRTLVSMLAPSAPDISPKDGHGRCPCTATAYCLMCFPLLGLSA